MVRAGRQRAPCLHEYGQQRDRALAWTNQSSGGRTARGKAVTYEYEDVEAIRDEVRSCAPLALS